MTLELNRFNRPRVVITGISAITPLGTTIQQNWDNLVAGRSGIRRITSFDTKNIGVKVAGEIDFCPIGINPKELRRMSRDSQMALMAANDALKDAGLTPDDLRDTAERLGVVIGTTLGGWEIGATQLITFPQQRIGPFALLNSLLDLPGYYIAQTMHAEGPTLTISTACTSGIQAIGEAARMIWDGIADVMFTGGVEGLVQEPLIAGLESMNVMAKGYADNPTEACRPFDADRQGLVYAEGCAILLLETLERAVARGARIYAEVLGYGTATDVTSPAIPDPSGKPYRLAMQWALKSAHINPDQVEYINPHGPGTIGDAVETMAIKQVFGDRAYKIPISSTKSMLGHSMGASGAIETAVTAMTVATGMMHPTINYTTPDPNCDLDYVPNQARKADVKIAMSNNLALGGHNASVVLGKV